MDEKMQRKVCYLLMVTTGALFDYDPVLAFSLSTELTTDEMKTVMKLDNEYEESEESNGE